MNRSEFVCKSCGKQHGGVPDLGFRRPDALLKLPPDDRARCHEFDDACEIPPLRPSDAPRYFLRTVLQIPLVDGIGDPPQRDFGFGPWVEVGESGFRAVQGQKPDQHVPPFPGTMATALPGFPNVLGVSVTVVPGSITERPRVIVVDDRNDLGKAQRAGITVHKAHEILEPYC